MTGEWMQKCVRLFDAPFLKMEKWQQDEFRMNALFTAKMAVFARI